MKIFHVTLLFFFSSFLLHAPSILAQDAYRTKMNSVFQNVDKTQASTKYIKEYGYPFLAMDNFNGTLLDSNLLDMNAWRMLYGAFATSYVGTTTPTIPALSNINTTVANYVTSGVIPVSLVYANYNDLRPDAISANLLTYTNGQIFDVAGRSQNPYRTQTLFASAPSISYSSTPVTQFMFNCDLIYTNLPGTFCSASPLTYSIAVDFADGLGYRAVTLGTAMNVSWALTGDYRIKVKATSSTGTVVQSWFYFSVRSVPCTNCYVIDNKQELIDPSFLTTPTHNLTSDPLGHSGGRVFYILSKKNTTGKIRKPLIIAEGFDLSLLAPELQANNYSLIDFLQEMDQSNNLYGPNDKSLNLHLDGIIGDGEPNNGYDLVFIDYNYGVDDIRRNANLFQNVLRRVNSEKASVGSTEQNVVWGSSMGGLVTRYGLASIVKNGYYQDTRLPILTSHDPQTRLLITHDSPHRGANIPVAVQLLLQYLHASPSINVGIFWSLSFKDLSPAIEQGYNVISNGVAAKQMLLYRATDAYNVVTNDFLMDGGDYRTMVDFPIGSTYTPQYQISALSNGSQCAQKTFEPNSTLLTGAASGGGTLLLGYIAGGNANATLRSAPIYGTTNLPIVDFHFSLKQIYLGFISYTTILDYVVNSPNIISPTPLQYLVSYDGSPGGLSQLPSSYNNFVVNVGFDSKNLDRDGNFGKALKFLFAPHAYGYGFTTPYTGFCFVPTGSALDANGFMYSPTAINQVYSNNLNVSSNNSSFPKFLAQSQISSITFVKHDVIKNSTVSGNFYSTPHISFATRNSIWLYERITNAATSGQECTSECNPYNITGSKLLCSYEYYSINSGGAPVTWVANPSNAAYMYITGAGTVILARNNLINAYFTLTASFQSGACTITSNPLNIEAGTVPMPFFSLLGPYSPVCPGGTANFTASVVDPNIEYTWSCISGNCGAVQSSSYGIGHSSNTYSVSSYATTGTSFTIQATGIRSNVCGTSAVPISSTFTVQIGGNCFAFFSVALSPNPASNVLNVSITDKSPNAKDDDEFEVTIADLVGNVKHNKKYKTKDNQIDITSLKTGNYSLRLIKTSGTDVVTKSFSVVK